MDVSQGINDVTGLPSVVLNPSAGNSLSGTELMKSNLLHLLPHVFFTAAAFVLRFFG